VSATGIGDDSGHLLDLLLGAEEGSESLLGELTGTLILGVLDQLHDAALVGSEASDLTDEGADEDDALASDALLVGHGSLQRTDGGDVSVVLSRTNATADGNSHYFLVVSWKRKNPRLPVQPPGITQQHQRW